MSSVVEQILRGVSDTRLLNTHRVGPSPLNDLVAAYKELSAHDDNLPNLTEESTGLDLKQGLMLMTASDQVALLHTYCQAANGRTVISTNEAGAKAAGVAEDPDSVKTKNWAIRVFVITGAICLCMLFGAVTAIAVRTGRAPSNEVVSTFLETAGEIAKMLFSNGKE